MGLGELPAGWEKAELFEICLVNPTIDKSAIADDLAVSFVPMPAVEAESGGMDVSATRKFGEVKKGYTPFREGDVLFAKITPCMENGKMAVVPALHNGLGFGSTEFHVLRAHLGISPQFVYYFVSSRAFRHVAEHNMSGAVGQRRVTTPYLSACRIPVPPTAEQHRIVAKIEELFSELDQGVASLKTAREQLKVYRQSLLKIAFEGKLTATWRAEHRDQLEPATALQRRIAHEREARYQQQLADWQSQGKPGPKPKPPKPLPSLTPEELAELPELPEGWGWFRLEDVSDVSGGLTKNQKREQLSATRPYLRVANVYANRLELDEVHSIGVTESELARVTLEKGDLLIVEGNGSIDQIGRVALWLGQISGCVHQNHLIKARPLKLSASKFLLYFLMSELGRKFIVRAASSTSGLHTLSISKVEGLFVPLCPSNEQVEVVAELESKLSEADQLDQTLATALQQADALRQSILKKAFCGQLVKQDKNDEPATALLERIRAERSSLSTTRRSRRAIQEVPKALELTPPPGKIIPFPVAVPGIAAKDLHAGILAMAYRLHALYPDKLPYFGHVKAEKISHLVEAHLGLDLERQPFKDVAGPNDHPHLKKVEHRAHKANWFDVTRLETGRYEFRPQSGFGRLLTKTQQALGGRLGEVERLLELMLPMTMRQAEILATVYAAWNNLLLLGKTPSDEEIVLEARENWHESKLKIERNKFFTALNWMRSKSLIPSGRGRFVAAKGE